MPHYFSTEKRYKDFRIGSKTLQLTITKFVMFVFWSNRELKKTNLTKRYSESH